ncbi:MAG: hypothetical protein LBR20_05690 [Propionibacteriaceae bacterium]|jgi:hypothetical protein|nr:hypothetical protein [Propionibacteriaceae bacterium]
MRKKLPFIAIALALAVPPTVAGFTDLARVHDVYSTMKRSRVYWGATSHHLPNTALAISDSGALLAWGLRAHGLPGNGQEFVATTDFPTQIWLPSADRPADDRRKAIKVAGVGIDDDASDLQHVGLAALSDDGLVYTWGGTNEYHMMGRTSHDQNQLYWHPGVVEIPGYVVDLVSTAGVFLALTADGDLYTWGWPQGYGVTGQSATNLDASSGAPKRILGKVHSIGAGLWNAWAIRGDYDPADPKSGVLWWGRADAGWDPSGDGLARTVGAPVQSKELSKYATYGCDAVGVVAGSVFDECAIQQLSGHAYGSQMRLLDGTVLTWGDASHHGTGRRGSSSKPTELTLPEPIKAVEHTRDYVFLVGFSNAAYLYGWYQTSYGPHPSTGKASRDNLPAPVEFTALGRDWVGVGLHGNSGHVRLLDGSWISWGGSVGAIPGNIFSIVPTAATKNPAGLTHWTPPPCED